MPSGTVFLLDVDNTLLDNDRFLAELRERIAQDFGAKGRDRYWQIFETMRDEAGYVDYLGAWQRFRAEAEVAGHADAKSMELGEFILGYPFEARLYPHALDVIDKLNSFGQLAILSDGDAVLQPRKVRRSGLWNAVEGRVMIFIHKEQRLAEIERRYPARHYVMVEDKLRLLAAMKAQLGSRLTTVFVRQGHYAMDTEAIKDFPAADLTVEAIGDLRDLDFAAFAHGAVR